MASNPPPRPVGASGSHAHVQTSTKPRTVASLAEGLRAGAQLLEYTAIFTAIAGVLGGVTLAGHQVEDSSDESSHPFVGLGIGIAVGVVLVSLFMWCVARALHIYGRQAGKLD